MSSVEAAEAVKVDGFKEQLLPLPVVEMSIELCYSSYCNNSQIAKDMKVSEIPQKMTELFPQKNLANFTSILVSPNFEVTFEADRGCAPLCCQIQQFILGE